MKINDLVCDVGIWYILTLLLCSVVEAMTRPSSDDLRILHRLLFGVNAKVGAYGGSGCFQSFECC